MANPSVTYTFVNSQTSDGTQVNQNFTDLVNALTDGTKDVTINNLTVNTAFIAKGTTQLGDASSDTIDVQARFINHPIPSVDNTYDLGTTSLRWRTIYIGTSVLSTAFISAGTNPASAGVIRLASTEGVEWRNNANSGNLNLNTTGGDVLQFNAHPILLNDGSVALAANWAAGAFSATHNSVVVGSSANAITALRTIGSDTSLTIQTNNGSTAVTINTTQDVDFAPTNAVYSGQAQAGTAVTNSSFPIMIGNSNSTTNNWASYGFTDGSSHSGFLNGFIACQFTDRTNHYGAISLVVRGAAGFVNQLTATSSGVSLVGNTSGSNASAGNFGERIISRVSAFTNIPGATGVWGNLTSISVTAGDWDLDGVVEEFTNTGTGITSNQLAISINSGTTTTDHVQGDNQSSFGRPDAASGQVGTCISEYQINVSSTTTVYLKLNTTYTGGNPQYKCRLSARRRS